MLSISTIMLGMFVPATELVKFTVLLELIAGVTAKYSVCRVLQEYCTGVVNPSIVILRASVLEYS